MGRLEYDDSAFAYFGLAVLTIFVVPFTLSFLRSIFGSSKVSALQKKNFTPRTTAEKLNLEKLKTSDKTVKRLGSCQIFGKAVILALCWYFIISMYMRTGGAEIKSFDPFEILGVDTGSTDSQIKKAFRKLSVQWHPDRWIQGTPEEQAYAEMMFMKISKASDALTDPVAKENWIKYGNPDGKQPMELSIGLPNFLLMKENHNLVLVLYLLGLVVVIPTAVAVYYSNSKQYSDKFILNESYQVYAFLLKNTPLKNIPEVFALSAEFRKMPLRPEDDTALAKLKKMLISQEYMPKKPAHNVVNFFKRWPQCEKVNVLLHAHMHRVTSDLPLTLKGDIETILKTAPILIEAMLDVAKGTNNLRMFRRVLQFEQHLTQAVYFTQSPLLQLPHFGVREAKHASSGKGAARSLQQFMDTKPVDDKGRRKGMVGFTDEQCKDVETLINCLPAVEFEVEGGCLDYEDEDKKVHFDEVCAAGDIITFYIELKRLNDKAPPSELGTVHAPFYPTLLDEEWVVTLGKAGNEDVLFGMTDIKENEKVVRRKMQVPSQGLKPGTYDFDVYLTSNCYVGLDQKVTVKVDLRDPSEVKPVEVHPEDIEAENTPGLFDLLQAELEEEDSDFGSDDEDEMKAESSTTEEKNPETEAEENSSKDQEDKKDK
mmetsp:Transcript_4408/g.5445  ORF Transcript_4408/g.5445 Transcript_4408/m.5445 type:complete len:654 (+) Transcript_4408:21-1982(+)